jgi:hypothetical protein
MINFVHRLLPVVVVAPVGLSFELPDLVSAPANPFLSVFRHGCSPRGLPGGFAADIWPNRNISFTFHILGQAWL